MFLTSVSGQPIGVIIALLEPKRWGH